VVSRRCAGCKFRAVGTAGKSVPGGSINGAIVIVAYRELRGDEARRAVENAATCELCSFIGEGEQINSARY